MKTKTIMFAMLIAFASCKKEEVTPVAQPPVEKTYAVEYRLSSSNTTATDFTVYYLDETGTAVTEHNVSSGWRHSFTGKAGHYVSIKAQSQTLNASVDVSIYYNSIYLSSKYASGSSTAWAQATAEGTLP